MCMVVGDGRFGRGKLGGRGWVIRISEVCRLYSEFILLYPMRKKRQN